MANVKMLNMLDCFKGIYKGFGVDYDDMKLILDMKLKLDARRTSLVVNNNVKAKENKKEKNQFTRSLYLYSFMGLMMLPVMIVNFNMMYQATIIFSYFMFMLTMILMSDFSSVLLDLKDKYIIGTRGISKKTLGAAKITHILIYTAALSLSLLLGTIVVSVYHGILFALVFLLEIILINVLLIGATSIIYFIVLKKFDGEKIRDIINFFQIILMLTMVVGYQIVPRLFNITHLSFGYDARLYHIFIPPMWYSAPLYLIKGGDSNFIIVTMCVLAFAMPIIAIALYIKNSSKFEIYLEKMNRELGISSNIKKSFSYKFDKILCKSNEEKTFFNFAWQMMKTERDFKLKTYPNLALGMALPLVSVFMGNMNMHISMFLFVILIPNTVIMLKYSESHKASNIFSVVYLNDKSVITRGTLKAFFVKLILPLWIIMSIIYIGMFKLDAIMPLLVVLLTTLLSTAIVVKSAKVKIPFSEEFSQGNVAGNIGVAFLIMILTIIIGLLTALITDNLLLMGLLIVSLVGINYLIIEK